MVTQTRPTTHQMMHGSEYLYGVVEYLKQRRAETLSVKDYGAHGDGTVHPLSEVYSTLSEAQAVFPFVTSLSQSTDYAALQAAANDAKPYKSVSLPDGNYMINSEVHVDYAWSIHGTGGQGLRDVSSVSHEPSQVRGATLHSLVTSGYCVNVSPPRYCFGLTMRDFAIWGVGSTADAGLRLHSVGWMGIVDSINIQQFVNQALDIGYIQDTYITNCSFIECGNQSKPAVTCLLDSNYVYFDKCHFELTPYMMKLNTCWFWSFSNCHMEVARPVGDGITPDDRYHYVSSCIDLGNSRNMQFSGNTFIPTDSAYLALKNGQDRGTVPYFMTGTGPYIDFSGDIVLAPEGSVDFCYFTGSHVNLRGMQFISLSPSKQSVYVANGKITDCTFAIKVDDDASRLYGAYLGSGNFSGNVIGFLGVDNGVKRSAGFLVTGGCTANGNEYPESNSVYKYLDNAATVYGFDGKSPRYRDVTATNDIDLTNYHPATHLRVSANNVTITHIYGSQLGRDVMVTTNNTGTVINYANDNVLTAGAVNFSLSQYHTALFKCVQTVAPVLQQIG